MGRANQACKRALSIGGHRGGVAFFFVGMQEYGHGICCYSKDEKLALIKVGLCKVFSYVGLFEFKGYVGDGWPRWGQVQGSVMPAIEKQEELIKTGLISFFRREQ